MRAQQSQHAHALPGQLQMGVEGHQQLPERLWHGRRRSLPTSNLLRLAGPPRSLKEKERERERERELARRSNRFLLTRPPPPPPSRSQTIASRSQRRSHSHTNSSPLYHRDHHYPSSVACLLFFFICNCICNCIHSSTTALSSPRKPPFRSRFSKHALDLLSASLDIAAPSFGHRLRILAHQSVRALHSPHLTPTPRPRQRPHSTTFISSGVSLRLISCPIPHRRLTSSYLHLPTNFLTHPDARSLCYINPSLHILALRAIPRPAQVASFSTWTPSQQTSLRRRRPSELVCSPSPHAQRVARQPPTSLSLRIPQDGHSIARLTQPSPLSAAPPLSASHASSSTLAPPPLSRLARKRPSKLTLAPPSLADDPGLSSRSMPTSPVVLSRSNSKSEQHTTPPS